MRPSALPHHRTCGLPHPAVGPSGLWRHKIRWHIETPALESSVVQDGLQHRAAGLAPGPYGPACLVPMVRLSFQSSERVQPSLAVVPAVPEVFPHVASHPAFPPVSFPSLVAYAEVVPPAPDVPLPGMDPFFQRDAPAGVPYLAHLPLPALHAPWSRGDLPLRGNPHPQKLAVPRAAHATFAGVDPQVQMGGNPGRKAGQHALPTPLTPHKDRDIVRIPAEAHPALGQFLVQHVQVEVRQQRTQGRPLRGPLALLFVSSCAPHRCAQIRAEQAQDLRVAHCATQPGHQPVRVDFIEEGADVQVDYPGLPSCHVGPCRVDRVMGTASGSVAITVGAEVRVQQRPQYLHERLLDDAILPFGMPNRCSPPCAFGMLTARTAPGW